MRTSIFVLAATLLAATAQAADRKLPSKFLGDWCVVNSTNESLGATFRRGRCRDTDGWMTVNVNGFRAHEEDCRVVSVTPAPNEKYQAKFKCHGEGETWTKNHRMSLDNKGRLIMK
jgi:hypothetical protein